LAVRFSTKDLKPSRRVKRHARSSIVFVESLFTTTLTQRQGEHILALEAQDISSSQVAEKFFGRVRVRGWSVKWSVKMDCSKACGCAEGNPVRAEEEGGFGQGPGWNERGGR
jgi:hypothetical protein